MRIRISRRSCDEQFEEIRRLQRSNMVLQQRANHYIGKYMEAVAEREHARDVACALEAEVARKDEALRLVEPTLLHDAPGALCSLCAVLAALAIDHGEDAA